MMMKIGIIIKIIIALVIKIVITKLREGGEGAEKIIVIIIYQCYHNHHIF